MHLGRKLKVSFHFQPTGGLGSLCHSQLMLKLGDNGDIVWSIIHVHRIRFFIAFSESGIGKQLCLTLRLHRTLSYLCRRTARSGMFDVNSRVGSAHIQDGMSRTQTT